jgi:hypothetical protein
MFKPFAFAHLSHLVDDFRQSYECWGHDLVKVRP